MKLKIATDNGKKWQDYQNESMENRFIHQLKLKRVGSYEHSMDTQALDFDISIFADVSWSCCCCCSFPSIVAYVSESYTSLIGQ